ncbi:hypothetical protein FGLOB1_6610 [Fusarium globosum]|uniref:Uncharacterized protein n=1 Tax=Fusarium globosum TaxID=78864 RepID=A0A8H6DAC0_9HYPO|nr:hypothetical protein FGLOB1_6610 [Fusarium globosum]
MSSHHNLGQTTESPSSSFTFSQLPRPLTLDLLPTEILLRISGEPGKDQTTLSAREFKGLCLLSPSLNKLYLPFHYFSNNYGAFRDAIRDADVRVMDRCVQLGAAPPVPDICRLKWELPESDGCQCLSELPYTHHRPIDELLESVYLGRAPIDNCIDTLKWLLDKGCDMKEQGDQHWYKANEHCDHKSTNLLDTIWGLFLDLTDESTNWEEQYCGEAADIFEQKIEILKEYRVADLGERKIPRKIVKAMRSLTTPIKASIAAVAHDREAQRCWETLSSVLIPCTSTRGLYVSDTDWYPARGDLATKGHRHRYNSFIINRLWCVYSIYHDYRLQNDQIRPTVALPWGNMGMKKRDDGRWQDREWMRVVEYEDVLPLPERTGDESSER